MSKGMEEENYKERCCEMNDNIGLNIKKERSGQIKTDIRNIAVIIRRDWVL